MGFKLLNRKFTTGLNGTVKPFANGNTGTFIEETIKVSLDFIFTSSVDEGVIINSGDSYKLSGGSWDDKPFLPGDSVKVEYTAINLIDGITITVNETQTVVSIDDDIIVLDPYYFTLEPFVGVLLPSLGAGSAFKITNLTRTTVEEIAINYNWIENENTFSLNSVIDGTIPTFRAVGINTMGVASVVNLVQVADKSGINFDSGYITRLADVSGSKIYEIKIRTFLPDFYEDLSEPDWFAGINCLKSVFKINALPFEGDPNNNMVIKGFELEGNNGWLNEEYNGNTSDFTLDTITIKANDGTIISAIDHNQKNSIEVDINCLQQAKYVALKLEIIPPESEYKNNEFTLLQNTLASTYRSTTGTYNQYPKDGKQSTLSVVVPTLGVAVANIKFDLEFNALAKSYLDSLPEQIVRITATLISGIVGGAINNEATVLLWQGQTQPQPLVNLPYDEVESAVFHQHNKDLGDLGRILYEGTTSDDILYNSKFKIKKSDNYLFEKIISRVIVKKVSDGTTFNLLQRSYNFDSFVTVGDITYFNIEEEINQYLDGPDRDVYSLKTLSNDATHYLVEINWSFFADWRYWVSLAAAFPEFYDLALPQNGQNNEWMRYLRVAGYEIYEENVLITSEDQAFNWRREIKLQDYEFNLVSPDINTVIKLYNEAGVEVGNLISGEVMRVEATHTNLTSNFFPATVYGWLKFRNFEGEPSKWISTEWDLQARNEPWQPLPSFTKAKITYPATNIAVVEALIDTNLISGDNFTIVAKIHNYSDTAQQLLNANVNLREVVTIKLPEFAKREDRGLDFCGKPFKVLASVSDSTTWKNDVTGLAFKLDSIDVFLEKDGVEIPALGFEVAFPYQEDAVGFVIDWRQHQIGGELLTGCYKIKIYYEVGGLEGFFYYGAYQLMNYTVASSEGDCRIYAILDDYVRESGINYRDSGFRNSVRFDGMFGWMQPNYDIENIIKTNRTREKVRIEAIRTYKLEATFSINCITNKIDFNHLLAASHIFVSDYNSYNHEDYRDLPVILDEESTPEYSYANKLPYAKIVTTFVDKQALWESKFSGKSGINQPKFGLEPISLGGGGGVCLPASYEVEYNNGTPIESGTIPSGGSKIIKVPDPVVCPTIINTSTITKTGALGSLNSYDDVSLKRGRGGANFFRLAWTNPFGHTWAYTGKTGGYYDQDTSQYKDKFGTVTTESLAFPDKLILCWKAYDQVTTSVFVFCYDYLRTGTNAFMISSAGASGYTRGGMNGFYVCNILELQVLFSWGLFAFNWAPLNYNFPDGTTGRVCTSTPYSTSYEAFISFAQINSISPTASYTTFVGAYKTLTELGI